MNRSMIAIILALIVMAAPASGGEGGSVYSRYGIGELRFSSTSRSAAMGGAGLAILSPSSIDHQNPAAWSHISLTRFSLSLLAESYSSSDATSKRRSATSRFSGAVIAIPVLTSSGIIASAGVVPYSTVEYTVTSPATQAGYTYNLTYEGDGGLSLSHIGFSAKALPDLNVGFKFNYYFGTLTHSISQSFPANVQSASSSDRREAHLRGIGYTFGAIYSGLGSVLGLRLEESLRFGVVFHTASSLTQEEERVVTYRQPSATTVDTITTPDRTLRIPYALGFGISFQDEQLILASDLLMQPWSRSVVGGLLSPARRNSLRWSGGAEFTPKRESTAPYFQRASYRAGVYYHQSYFELGGKPVNEMGATAGAAFPLFADTRLSIGILYGVRGSKDVLKDSILRMSFILSGGERWFVRPQDE